MSERGFEQEYELSENGNTLAAMGREVRRIREERGISIAQVSEATRIRVPHIEAIEEGRFEDLPGRVYARGFLRSYLSYLEATDLWSEYDRLLPLENRSGLSEVTGSVNPPAKGFHRHSKWWLYALLILGMVVSIFLVWNRHSAVNAPAESQDASVEMAASLPEDSETVEDREVEVLEEGIPIVEEPVTSEDRILAEEDENLSGDVLYTASAGGVSEDLEWLAELSVDMEAVQEARMQEPILTDELTLSFTGACWVRVKTNDETLFQGTLQAGDSRTFDIEKETSVRFGNARAVDVAWRGEDFAPLSERSAVLEVVFVPGEPFERP